MKLKGVLFTAILLATMSNCLSSDNYRMGLSLGGAYHNVKIKSHFAHEEDKFVKSSPSVGVFAGIDHLIAETPMFLGLELGANNHNTEKERHVDYGQTLGDYCLKLKTNNTISGVLRFGVSSGGTSLYGKAGLSSTNWRMALSSVGNEPQTYAQKSFQTIGHVGGIGIESRMSPNFSVGIEHECAFNKKFKFTYQNEMLKVRPIVHTTSFKLIYTF